MKTNNRISYGLTVAVIAFALFSGVAANAHAKSKRDVNTTYATVQSIAQPARLIIRRFPTLGANVIVDLYVDGAPFSSVTYGRTLDATLSPGRHVLSVQATPGPIYITRTNTTLDAQGGETYTFTAEDNGSGNLVLK
jgi:hypothetical protein